MAVELFSASNIAYLGAADASEEKLKEISPARYVSEFTPPTFLWSTSQDNLVSVQHSILMAKALADKESLKTSCLNSFFGVMIFLNYIYKQIIMNLCSNDDK